MQSLILLGLILFCSGEEVSNPVNPNCSHVLFSDETTTAPEPSPTFPATSFTCWGRYDGYYADIEVDCTIFHYCQTFQYPSGLNETVKWDFACPQNTIFNQKVLSCTLPNISFDCQESPNYYWINYNLTLTATTTTTTTAVALTEPTTTPDSNVGQQLIIGGLEPQSVEFPDTTDSPVTSSPVVEVTESELGSERLPSEIPDSDAIYFTE